MKKIFIIIMLLAIGAYADAQSGEQDSMLAKIAQIENEDQLGQVLSRLSQTMGGDLALLKQQKTVLSDATAEGNIKKEERALSLICHADFDLYDAPALLENSLKGIRLSSSINDKHYLSRFEHRVALACELIGDSRKSANYCLQAANTALAERDTAEAINSFSNLESDYAHLNQADSALYYAKLDLKLVDAFDKSGKRLFYTMAQGDLGEAFRIANRPDSALAHYRRAYNAGKKPGSQGDPSFSYMLNNMAKTFVQAGQPDSALKYAQESYSLSSKTRIWNFTYDASSILAKVYEQKGDGKAVFYLKAEMAAMDSMNAANALRRFQLVNDKEQQRLQDLKTAQQKFEAKVRLYIAIGAAAILLAIGIILWRNNRKQKHSNRLLSEQKEEISAQRDQLENKNLELEIEAGLERVRSRAMAMQKSGELSDLVATLVAELSKLDMALSWCLVTLLDEASWSARVWRANSQQDQEPQSYYLPFADYPFQQAIMQAWNERQEKWSYVLTGDEKKAIDEYMFTKTGYSKLPEPVQAGIRAVDPAYFYFSFGNFGGLQVGGPKELSDESLNILARFGKVFDLTYTRFNDLKQAEAQAREGQIELALERVRARTMAMQHSDELAETAYILFQQFRELGENPDQATIGIVNETESVIEYWVTIHGNQTNRVYKFPVDEPNVTRKIYEGWKEQEKSLVIDLTGEALLKFSKFRESMGGAGYNPDEKRRIINVAFFSKGLINVQSTAERSPESLRLLERFAKVFEGTYTRFLDLQKAEAQARESQIQLALERVRARTMAMRKSDELRDTVKVVFERLQELDFAIDGAVFIETPGENAREINIWIGDNYSEYPNCFRTPFYDAAINTDIFDAIGSGLEFFSTTYSFEEKNKWFSYAFEHTDYKNLPEELKSGILGVQCITQCFALTKNSGIGIHFHDQRSLSGNEIDILKRFSRVFEQSYVRFLDLQKAEAQAREAQIQLALERIRARTMAMRQSAELADISFELFKQIQSLGTEVWHCAFRIYDDGHDSLIEWSTNVGGVYPQYRIPNEGIFRKYHEAGMAGETLHIEVFGEDRCTDHYAWLCKLPEVGERLLALKEHGVLFPTSQIEHVAFFKYGYLIFITYEPAPAAHSVFKRFAKVFEQTYTRFLDLKQAEEQAREAKIEAALERVRSRSMGMQKSDELKDVIQIVFEQFVHLDIGIDHTGFVVDYKPGEDWHLWIADHIGSPNKLTICYFDSVWGKDFDAAKNKGIGFFVTNLDFEAKNKFYRDMFEHFPEMPQEYRDNIFSKPALAASTVLMENVGLYIENFAGTAYTDEENAILVRFGKVFQQTYTRFLDLQKAELQGRESQIQLALERARAQSMMMQYSNELDDTLRVFHEQVLNLGIASAFSFLWLPDEEKDRHIFWAAWAENNGKAFKSKAIDYPLDRADPATAQCLADWMGGDPVVAYRVPPEGVETYFAAWQELVGGVENLAPEYFRDGLYYVEAFMKYGCFGVMVGNPLTDDEKGILGRFAVEFERTYTRFLDLKKAEIQAREAQIEASLERVRSRTTAMRNSEELAGVLQTIFDQFVYLGIPLASAGFVINSSDTKDITLWVATHNDEQARQLTVPYIDHPILNLYIEARKKGLKFYPVKLNKVEKDSIYRHILKYSPGISKERQELVFNAPGYADSHVLTEDITLYIQNFTGIPFSDEENSILVRFGNAFQQIYTRFTDLKKAEEQAREAQIEAALEKVRSRTLAMQKSDELAETAAVLFRQMIGLGIEPNRLYIGIAREETTEIEFWITDEDGSKVSTMFSGDASKSSPMKKMYDSWKAREKSLVIDVRDQELADYFSYLGSLNVPFKGGLAQTRRMQYISFFSGGFIGLASPDDQPHSTVDLLDRFAYVFNLTFARFNDLKLAEMHAIQAVEDLVKLQTEKKRAEDALTDLRAAQTQLIQSEKMASLGELTAGIAHEIQNPLNFVNNFSEVNQEMIDELEEELNAGNIDEALAIAADIKQNEQKINHHGKRADGIVKGMLQHSRTAGGEKLPTNINSVAEEYMRLSYHGLRAKDKQFNAEMVMNFDADLPKVKVVGQDIGRVFLNLFNNAFYAVNQKMKMSGSEYRPEVAVSTATQDGQVTIKIKDNGVGIPDSIREKIMQPFFTTKPTGEGTGLGLSLTYDMVVKGHGGSIQVNSIEGEGSEFIIALPQN